MARNLLLPLLLGACSFPVVTLSQKTSLERQLIGELEPLSEEELLAASVRAEGSGGTGSTDAMQQRAVAARRRQLFNRDDVDDLKAAGCLGEGAGAKLVARECDAARSELAHRLVREENDDRAAIIDWAIEVDPVLTAAERDQVVALYASLLRQQVKPGEWFQEDGGSWSRK